MIKNRIKNRVIIIPGSLAYIFVGLFAIMLFLMAQNSNTKETKEIVLEANNQVYATKTNTKNKSSKVIVSSPLPPPTKKAVVLKPTLEPKTSPSPTATSEPKIGNGITTVGSLNLRTEPSLRSLIITKLYKEMPLQILGKSKDNEWLLIKTLRGDLIGWVKQDYVRMDTEMQDLMVYEHAETSPTLTPTPINWDKNGDGYVRCDDFKTRAEAMLAYLDGYKGLVTNASGIPCDKLP